MDSKCTRRSYRSNFLDSRVAPELATDTKAVPNKAPSDDTIIGRRK